MKVSASRMIKINQRTLVPPLQGAAGAQRRLGVAANQQLFRLFGKTACRYNPQSASLTAPWRGGTRVHAQIPVCKSVHFHTYRITGLNTATAVHCCGCSLPYGRCTLAACSDLEFTNFCKMYIAALRKNWDLPQAAEKAQKKPQMICGRAWPGSELNLLINKAPQRTTQSFGKDSKMSNALCAVY